LTWREALETVITVQEECRMSALLATSSKLSGRIHAPAPRDGRKLRKALDPELTAARDVWLIDGAARFAIFAGAAA
jgi:hypothetical protein